MTEEDRTLLLKDLITRLPYGVKYMKYSWGYDLDQEIPEVEVLEYVDKNGYISHTKVYTVEDIKPYLFPISSMTEEQKNECFKGKPLEIDKYGDIAAKDCIYGNSQYTDLEIYLEVIDWLNAHHFDYRGLIEKSLAIDATNLNIY